MKFPSKYVTEQISTKQLHLLNKYCNRLDMNKTGGNAIWLKLTNLQPALENLQVEVRGKVRNSWNQDCGAETPISSSGTSSRHPKFLAPPQTSKIFSLRLQDVLVKQLKTISLFVQLACYTKYVCWTGTQISGSSSTIHNFVTPAPGSSSTALIGTNCFWKWITLFLQMQLHSFCLFVFCAN